MTGEMAATRAARRGATGAPGAPGAPPARPLWTRLLPGTSAPALRLFERNVVAWKGMWLTFVSVVVEPVLYLVSIGIGVGALVGNITLANGDSVSYKAFVAPGLLAASAMLGPVFDTTFNFFVKLKYAHVYDAVLATPMRTDDVIRGEILWSLVRAGAYAVTFLVAMLAFGLVASWWALLAVPVAILIGYAFAGVGLCGSTFMRSWLDFDWVNVAILPMFLLSATFFPVTQYPPFVQHVVALTPLYQGVVLERALVLGDVSWWLLFPVAYLAVMGTVGLRIASRRMRVMLQP
jgi:lipooligosaccharide transport system permease protein